MKKRILLLILIAACLVAQQKDSNVRALSIVTFSALGTPANGAIVYCSDCTAANPTAGSGTGAIVRRENGAWNGGSAGVFYTGATPVSNSSCTPSAGLIKIDSDFAYYCVSTSTGYFWAQTAALKTTWAAAPLSSLSLNFVGTGTPMATNETAGSVSTSYWNNLAGATGTNVALVSTNGGATTQSTATWVADGIYASAIANTPGNYRMMQGFLDNSSANPITVTINGIAPGNYSVFVNADGANAAEARSGTYAISGNGITAASKVLTDAANTDFSGSFTPADGSAGNYVRFDVSVLSNVVITATPIAGPITLRAPINSIQIIPTANVVLVNQGGSVTTPPGFFISQVGNDTWAGTIAAPNGSGNGPWATLAHAQAALRASGGSKQVNLRAGTYVTGIMNFDSSDNGEIWKAYPGELPVISGNNGANWNLQNPSSMTFYGLTFQQMTANSLNFFSGGNLVTIQNNTFNNCVQACIAANQVTNFLVDTNTIFGQSPGNPPGVTYTGYSAINFYGISAHNTVSNNLIQNTQGCAIGFGNGADQAPGNHDNTIIGNTLINVVNNATDLGGIYIYDPTSQGTGNLVKNNTIQSMGGPNGVSSEVKGIYLDDLTSNVTVTGNIVKGNFKWAFQIHGGGHNAISNNVFDLSYVSASNIPYFMFLQSSPFGHLGLTQTNTVFKNIFYSAAQFNHDDSPASLYYYFVTSPDTVFTPNGNMYYSATGASIPNAGMVDSSQYLYNPLFTNPSANDYTMPPTSPAITVMGWVPLPLP